MTSSYDAFTKLQRRFSIAIVVLLVTSLWPISQAASSRDWGSVALLVTLDVAMIAVWLIGERRRSALREEKSNDGPATSK